MDERDSELNSLYKNKVLDSVQSLELMPISTLYNYRAKCFVQMYLVNVLLYDTDYMKLLRVCHHPNAISLNNKEFDISVIIHGYLFLN